ncbi:MAG: amidohydrolase [Candidatus Bathyarchaeota archaeon]|nr:amidohydrolase [Candidatus Bathyarchaeota archaeon]
MSASKACIADLALLNGKILTVDKDFTTAEAVAVKDGKIQAVGTTSEIKKLVGDSTEVVDLEGKTVMPGLYDSHLHLIGTGLALQWINCRTPPLMSIEDMKKAVAEKVKAAKPSEWILGRGWDQAKLAEHRNPSRWDFDEVAPDNPVVLTRTCGHLLVANSKALEIAGVSKDTPQPVGGQIVKDENGEPTGMMEEGPAMILVRKHIPPTGIPETMDAIKTACTAFNKVGITSVIDAGNTEDEMVAYQLLKEKGELTVRTNMMLRAIQGQESIEDSVKRIMNFPMLSGYGDDLLRFQGLKILIDGGIGGKTALLREPYENDPEDYGLLTVPVDNLQKLVDAANKRGMLCGIHCCGGKAMDIVLDAFKATDKIKSIKGRRFYLIHAYQPSEENFKDCRDLGIQVASQPSFLYYLGDSYYENVGHERSQWLKPHRAWLDEGIMTASGTDSPVTPYPPFPSLWAAIARRSEVKGTQMGIEQKITREESIRMYTINGAYLTFEEDIKGSLEPGKLADMIILDRDIMTCPIDEIKDIRVLKTMLDGKIVYST